MNDDSKKVNVTLAAALRAEAQALDLQAAAKRAQADAIERSAAAPDRELLTHEQALERYGYGRDALLNAHRAGKLELIRGARNRIMVERTALEAHIKSRPVQPRRKVAPVADLGDWEAQAEKALRSAGGCR